MHDRIGAAEIGIQALIFAEQGLVTGSMRWFWRIDGPLKSAHRRGGRAEVVMAAVGAPGRQGPEYRCSDRPSLRGLRDLDGTAGHVGHDLHQ